MDGYRHEHGEWTDGFGRTHQVVRFYVPDDDDEWMMCEAMPDGTCRRLISRGPVYMRTGWLYASVDAAANEVEAAHRDWLASDRDGWKRAIGVLKPRGDVRPPQPDDNAIN